MGSGIIKISEKKLLNIVASRGSIVYNNFIKTDKIIIDFFNIYCCLIYFAKYNIFSKDTFLICMKKIAESLPKDKEIFIISKPIFEISYNDIISSLGANMKFIIIEDTYQIKSNNRERDDYFCLLLQEHFNEMNKSSVIISNDYYSNFDEIKNKIKKFNAVILSKNKGFDTLNMSEENLKNNSLPRKINRTGFKIKRKIF